MVPVNDLSSIDVDEVSPVRAGAIRKKWALLKSDDQGDLALSHEVVDVLGTPIAGEAELVAKLEKDGFDDPAREGRILIERLTKAFYPAGQHTPAEAAAIRAGSVPELQGAGEDDDEDAVDDEDDALTQATLIKADSPAAYVLAQVEKALAL